ncbi:MAG: isoleucine--tRNA ligase [Pirellulales bacterium]|nr:isoleucine--tRNA ligase [Pirellulales bacterium]
MFPSLDNSQSFPEREQAVLRLWREQETYHKTLAARAGAPTFVFYEGPPTANGMPHPGHCLTRAIKDLFPRYKTMRGYLCERKAGWDTHGLPVEVEVCKELGIHAKEEIEAYGVEPFIHKCQQSVWRYMTEWERLTERLGFWVDLKNAYVTYHKSYVESVWWSLKNLFDRGLLYKGHKIVWWWAQGGTALSSGEVGQGYRQVADPSVYVKFPLLDEDGNVSDTSLLVWTTTPWTLPSNHYAAINARLEYSCIIDPDDKSGTTQLIVASNCLNGLLEKKKANLQRGQWKGHQRFPGSQLLKARYIPPYDCFYAALGSLSGSLDQSSRVELAYQNRPDGFSRAMMVGAGESESLEIQRRINRWRLENENPRIGWIVTHGDFVTTDSGTGLVHIAPAFGEDDFSVLTLQRTLFAIQGNTPNLLNCVAPNGKFTEEAPEFVRGRWVKDCDKDIIRNLKERGLLFHQEQYLHDYPFCWRAEEDPLIQYPRESWFIRTTAFKDAMLENNSHINWLPEHIKEGRFGKFLESNVDWALSRERFWGTPLPIWVCDACGQMEAIGGYDELLAKPGVAGTEAFDRAKEQNPHLPEDLRVHKPYIDEVTYACPRCAHGAGHEPTGASRGRVALDEPFEQRRRPAPAAQVSAMSGVMRRVTEVIDCWYDSGAMPFAQWGYRGDDAPDGNGLGSEAPPPQASSEPGSVSSRSPAQRFHDQFPADFISEAIDQTRGWFYSQLAISTMMFGDDVRGASGEARATAANAPPYPHPFKNCIVLGLMLGEDGQKMSKSKRNYREPSEIFDRYGADALRWYFFANQPPWTSIRYSEQAIKDSVPEFLLRLWNVFSFFTIYANIDGFQPEKELAAGGSRSVTGESQLTAAELAQATTYRPLAERNELDRWIVSELHRTAAAVVERMDAYDNFAACARLTEFVDALSNWYVRRSRDRFWAKDTADVGKRDAYWTLYECLVTTAKLIAPFTPFLAESLWQNLVVGPFAPHSAHRVVESVHLCDYPTGDAAAIDQQLSERMNMVRHIASLGRQARTSANLKVRQPLARVEVILADATHQAWLEEHAAVIADELNVKAVEYSDQPEKYVQHEVLPNFKLLGPKLGKLMPKVKGALAKQSGSELLANIRDNGKINLTVDGQQVELTGEEVEIRITAREGWTAANDKGVVIVLATELTPELIAEGLARDLVRAIQDRRKEIGCEFTDRIVVGVVTESADLADSVKQFGTFIAAETLAQSIGSGSVAGAQPTEAKVGDADATLFVKVAP